MVPYSFSSSSIVVLTKEVNKNKIPISTINSVLQCDQVVSKPTLKNNYPKISSLKRIGPHNIDILSIIVGSALGDTHLEKRKRGIGTRVIFEQSNKNVEYLMWFHKYLADRGYCNPQKPKLQKRIRKNNEITFHYRINSYTFFSFN